jgi:hypothetical protein
LTGAEANYSDSDTIKFPVTRVNVVPVGSKYSGYNNSTGYYTCPVSGHYLFIVSLFKQQYLENNCGAALWHTARSGDRDTRLQKLHNWQYDSTRAEFTSSMHSIVHCSAGDSVRVKVLYGCVLFDNVGHHNQFSGVLLNQLA